MLVVDASVGLKWVLQEADSSLAERLARSDVDLLVPDFWLNEACNVLWLQVRRKLFTPSEAREALALLRAQVEPTPTAELSLHDVALEIGLAINHSTYDILYVAFALAMGAERVVVADGPFVTAMHASGSHPRRNTPAARAMGRCA
jgi:predicted nucleic acid-binding protein